MRTLLITAVSLLASCLVAQEPGARPGGQGGQNGSGGQGGGQRGGQNGERPRGDRPAPPPIELQHFTFAERAFESAAIDTKEAKYSVYLPKGYDDPAHRETRWPLVVWLHGMFEDHLRFHRRGGAPVLDRAVEEKLLPPCVFVLANGGRTSMYINAGKGRDYQDLVQKDLLAHVDATYRVAKDRGHRALMGISMGGMASLRIGFTQPQLFGTVAVHSSAVFPADPKQLPPRLVERAAQFGLGEVFGDPIDAVLWRATNPLGIAEGLDPETLDGLRLYFDAGTEDRFEFGKTNQLLHQVLDTKKVAHTWNLVQGGGHAWGSGFQDDSLLASLKFVGEGFALADAAAKAKAPAGSGDGKDASGGK
jgi:enterochelin esterase-like enzyme